MVFLIFPFLASVRCLRLPVLFALIILTQYLGTSVTYLYHRHTSYNVVVNVSNHRYLVVLPGRNLLFSDLISSVVTPDTVSGTLILRWDIRLDKHLAEILKFFWTSHFFRQEGKLNDMEEFVIEFMSFIQVFLLHLVTDTAMFAIRA